MEQLIFLLFTYITFRQKIMATLSSRKSSRTPKPNQKYVTYVKQEVKRPGDGDSEGESSSEEMEETEQSPKSSPVKQVDGKHK